MSVNYNDLFGPAQSQPPSVSNLMEWGHHLSVNHPDIDAQHREIFDLGAKIYESWRNGASVDTLRPAVDKLAVLLEAHFSYEEGLLAEIGYDRLEEHAAEHRSMLSELKKTQENFQTLSAAGGTLRGSVLAPGWPIMRLILGFTIAHVMTSDMNYSKALVASHNPISGMAGDA